jgi:type IX secretion system PorP/SprF family membrane protein
MKQIKLILIIALIWSTSLKAQQDVLISQYMFSGMYLNPAYAGTHEYFNATGLFRKQWVGFNGAPTSQFLSIDGPLKNKRSGVGLVISHDKIGVTKQFELGINYAYHLDLNEKFKLSLGLKGNVVNYSANLTELTYWDNDVVFEKNIRNEFMPNFGLGGYLFSDKTFVGISIPHLLSYDPTSTFNASALTSSFKLVRSYYLHAGHAIIVNKSLTLKPSTLIKYTPNSPIQADLNLNALIKERLWIGGTYRTDKTIVGIVEYLITPKLRIGYSYGMSAGLMRSYNSGSHEIMLAFDFVSTTLKMKNPRYF